MPGTQQNPSYFITQNASDSHQTNSGWVVYRMSFYEPASSYRKPGAPGLMQLQTGASSIIQNDIVSVNVNNDKTSFYQTANITLKVSDQAWQSSISAGDWIVIWMSNDAAKISEIVKVLQQPFNSWGNLLCNWDSCLKFVGRVIGVTPSYVFSGNGVQTVTVNVSCQAFLELATSVYFTTIVEHLGQAPTGAGDNATESAAAGVDKTLIDNLRTNIYSNKVAEILNAQIEKFTDVSKFAGPISPDYAILFLLTLLMGMKNTSDDQSAPKFFSFAAGGSISIPPQLGALLGKSNAQYTWQLYNLYLGLQTYSRTNGHPWQTFAPDYNPSYLGTQYRNTWFANDRCKGSMPVQTPYWTNETISSIISEYTNDAVNELYTSLRINYDNKIGPSITIREKPFTTGLINNMKLQRVISSTFTPVASVTLGDINSNRDPDAKVNSASAPTLLTPIGDQTQQAQKSGNTSGQTAPDQTGNIKYTYYNNLPRWVIDSKMVRGANLSTSEQNRINFVQVWGQSGGTQFYSLAHSPDEWRGIQMAKGNAVYDSDDIQRNGLRANIVETQWDYGTNDKISNTSTNFPWGEQVEQWARMRAAWLFNGHLKLEGTIICNGINEPICEGDNFQYLGRVFHIVGVNHAGSIDKSGMKQFVTTVSVKEGVSARNLNGKNPPIYACHESYVTNNRPDMPAQTNLVAVPNLPQQNEG